MYIYICVCMYIYIYIYIYIYKNEIKRNRLFFYFKKEWHKI